MHVGTLGALTWDPFVRGVLILALFILLLPGSVYLLLATNTGIRLGFLVAGAGFVGLIALLSILWIVLGSTAAIGRPNSWKPLEVVTGDFASNVTVKGVRDLPADPSAAQAPQGPLPSKHWYWPFQGCPVNGGWYNLSTSKLTDAESAADNVLAPTGGGAVPTRLTSPFSATADYVYLNGYEKNPNGGCLFAWGRHKVYLPYGRGAHYEVVLTQPALPPISLGGKPATPQPDTSKPVTYVILERNLGSVHQPQMVVAICSLIVFLILCDVLHRRDKDLWAQQEADTQGGGAPPDPEREKVGAPA